MILYNCESELELQLKNTDLTKLTVSELRTLAVGVATAHMNDRLNDIIAMDVMLQITAELASRC